MKEGPRTQRRAERMLAQEGSGVPFPPAAGYASDSHPGHMSAALLLEDVDWSKEKRKKTLVGYRGRRSKKTPDAGCWREQSSTAADRDQSRRILNTAAVVCSISPRCRQMRCNKKLKPIGRLS